MNIAQKLDQLQDRSSVRDAEQSGDAGIGVIEYESWFAPDAGELEYQSWLAQR
ncbi:MAG TPA: hypothetical protein VIV54_04935 [Burkholderiales bacterium]